MRPGKHPDVDRDRAHRRSVLDVAAVMVAAARRGELDTAVEALLRLRDDQGRIPRADLRLLLAVLVRYAGQLLSGIAGDAAGPDTDPNEARLQLLDENGPVPVDRVAPPDRTILRAVLAAMHGHPEDADLHISIAVDNAERQHFSHLIGRAVELASGAVVEAERRRLPIPALRLPPRGD
ncbi:hypothetical protein LX15_005471 [Streptoalloteichus tenebrarius]|uniref:Uncharacterized protein n=1 Tax=Streptoalloteichus tenebrarius (strain ATCC 17920 / DSM 40477 / JCM 4838 / CBS 697.72 / NBRC 16177 / NCIMB 11028 / NRRL B-12390 / A12253. 1 / ISP 5477) TaxID=1933 RepID=A0ABT1I1X4_STRSD|nr:hypothetical protein [Streptoalloteichus tenebrarius]BFF00800.1 hypothetical protein GCM10020241_24750 [Streptoalloteichus tenebrarius]